MKKDGASNLAERVLEIQKTSVKSTREQGATYVLKTHIHNEKKANPSNLKNIVGPERKGKTIGDLAVEAIPSEVGDHRTPGKLNWPKEKQKKDRGKGGCE